jgi:hypothetical protein
MALKFAQKFVPWDVIFIVSDIDEFPHRKMVHHVKNCIMAPSTVVVMDYKFMCNSLDSIAFPGAFHGFVGVPQEDTINIDVNDIRDLQKLGKRVATDFTDYRYVKNNQAWHLRGFGGPFVTLIKSMQQAEGEGKASAMLDQIKDPFKYFYEMITGVLPGVPVQVVKDGETFPWVISKENLVRFPWAFLRPHPDIKFLADNDNDVPNRTYGQTVSC